jgi:hypothetical protein
MEHMRKAAAYLRARNDSRKDGKSIDKKDRVPVANMKQPFGAMDLLMG